MNYKNRLLRAIPGGAHTYSRGFDQFPENAPQILKRGEGSYVFDDKNQQYLDYGMALRSVNLGYANKRVNQAAFRQIEFGNSLTRPSMIELEAAELLIDLIDSVDMVKFTKNGSTATTAAIKLSRAYTGKDMVARCSDHPFFSYDDWFIGSTVMKKGVQDQDIEKTVLFSYNDIKSLESVFDRHPEQIACVILEPSSTEHPKDEFLQKVKALCNKHNAVFILDEMITGFRWHMKGAQHYYNIEADLCTFGKAMANGFSVAAVAGKREIMEMGSIETTGQERLFLLSTTHGAEMGGLGAFVESVKVMEDNDVVGHLWRYGGRLISMMNSQAKALGLERYFVVGGVECSPYYLTFDNNGNTSLDFRTLFAQEMLKNGVMMPWLSLSWSHQDLEFELTEKAVFESLKVYQKALDHGCLEYLSGNPIKPVFRKYN